MPIQPPWTGGTPVPPAPTITTFSSKTANYTVLTGDNETIFQNSGATANIILTLPAAITGLKYGFYVTAAFNLTVQASGVSIIRNGTDVSSAGGTISSNAIGNFIKIIATSSNEWMIESITGIWTIA